MKYLGLNTESAKPFWTHNKCIRCFKAKNTFNLSSICHLVAHTSLLTLCSLHVSLTWHKIVSVPDKWVSSRVIDHFLLAFWNWWLNIMELLNWKGNNAPFSFCCTCVTPVWAATQHTKKTYFILPIPKSVQKAITKLSEMKGIDLFTGFSHKARRWSDGNLWMS